MKLPDILCPGHHSRHCHLVTVSLKEASLKREPRSDQGGITSFSHLDWNPLLWGWDERRAGEKGSPKACGRAGRGQQVGCGGRRGAGVLAVCRCCVSRERRRQRREGGRRAQVWERGWHGVSHPQHRRPKLGGVKMGPQLPCRDATSLPVPLLALPGSPGLPADPLALGNNSGARAGHCESVRRPRPALSSHREGAVGSQSPWRWYRLYPAQSI